MTFFCRRVCCSKSQSREGWQRKVEKEDSKMPFTGKEKVEHNFFLIFSIGSDRINNNDIIDKFNIERCALKWFMWLPSFGCMGSKPLFIYYKILHVPFRRTFLKVHSYFRLGFILITSFESGSSLCVCVERDIRLRLLSLLLSQVVFVF